jgi:hypothetical protein
MRIACPYKVLVGNPDGERPLGRYGIDERTVLKGS